MFVFKAAVVGAGTMGAAIAQLAAYQGLHVVLKDIRQDLVDEGLKRVESLMTRHAFKTEVDDEARTFLFPQNARLIPPGVEVRS